MATISAQDIADCKLDILTIDEVVESNSPTAITKDGKTIKTLAGKLAELGYQVPVAYAGGIVFGAMDFTKTVSQGGFIYAPFPESLPFTTTVWGTDSAFFFVVQNGAGSVAASSVTYSNATSGLAATDAQAAIDEVEGRVDTAETNITTLTTKQNNLITLSGVAANSTSLGTFTGVTIPDSQTVKQALQAVETAYEATLIRNGGTAGGTANALTCTCTPAITALTEGQVVILYTGALSNTARTATFAPDGLTAKPISKPGLSNELEISDYAAYTPIILQYSNYLGGRWVLVNPRNGSGTQIRTDLPQTYTGGSTTYTFAHGLGVEPTFVSLRMTVKSGQTDLNYTDGRTVILGDTANSGYTIETDATNVYVRVATTGLTIINATTYGNGVVSTASKWDMSVRAFA